MIMLGSEDAASVQRLKCTQNAFVLFRVALLGCLVVVLMSASSSSGGMTGPGEVKQAQVVAMETVPVPVSFKCPITHEIMSDPVVTCDGHVYERSAIQDWFRRAPPGNIISPVTLSVLGSRELPSETPLKRAIDEYLSMRPEIQRVELDRLSLARAAAMLEEQTQK